jgi:hypothetical protein
VRAATDFAGGDGACGCTVARKVPAMLLARKVPALLLTYASLGCITRMYTTVALVQTVRALVGVQVPLHFWRRRRHRTSPGRRCLWMVATL